MTTLGRYEIVDQIGIGSMGTVYRARDTVLDRDVALKTIRTGVDVEPELRERFHREARACARLQHPSIVVVYDLGEVDRTAYIAMELLSGFDFRKLIDARTDIPLAVRIEAMAQVSEALAYAHRHGIIHRDIKPSNLFLVDNKTAKVLDFGIARLPSSRLTVAGRILGTPNYMAPEQILVQPTDGRSDLFSAAVVFFEFLVFAHPFRSDIIPRRIVEGEPDSLFDHDSKLPAPLEKIFERALAKDPNRRYRTGDEMGADFRAVLEALLQNVSSTFSHVQLPSDREIQAASTPEPSQVDASCLRPPPPGEDPHEWRLSELMRLIPEFEAAASSHDVLSARQAFRQLEAIGAVDSRFVDAVQLCHFRLGELESPPVAAGTELSRPGPADSTAGRPVAAGQGRSATGGDQGTMPKTCGECGATNRSAAAYCIQCGGSLLAAMPVPAAIHPEPPPFEALPEPVALKPVPEPAPIKPIPEPAPIQPVPEPVELKPVAEPAPIKPGPEPTLPDVGATMISSGDPWPVEAAPGPPVVVESPQDSVTRRRVLPPRTPVLPRVGDSPQKPSAVTDSLRVTALRFGTQPRRWWVAAGVAVCAAGAWFFLASPSEAVRPAAATAVVKLDSAVLYRQASVGPGIATLTRGDRVNVLSIPSARDQEWIPVQFVVSKPLHPGYMLVSDLEGWDSEDPATKAMLKSLFETSVSTLLAKARGLVKAERWHEALEVVDHILRIDSGNRDALRMRDGIEKINAP